jgi:hypothetical protein
MPLRVVIEPVVEIAVEAAAEVASDLAVQLVGESSPLPPLRKSYSDAYCRSFFCMRCPGMAKGRRGKLGWYLYRCQDCGSGWGVLKDKPWVRREKRKRGRL